MALAVEGPGKSGGHVRHLAFLAAAHHERAYGRPIDPRQVDIGGKHVIAGQVLVDRRQLLGGIDLDYFGVLLYPVDGAVVGVKGEHRFAGLVHLQAVGSGFGFAFQIAERHIQALAVALFARVRGERLEVGGLDAVHKGDAVAVPVYGHVEFDRGVFLAERAHVRLPLAHEAQRLKLRDRFRRVGGVIHVFQAEQADHVVYQLRVRVHREACRQPVGVRSCVIERQRVRIAAVAELKMESLGGRVGHYVEIPEFPGVLVRGLVQEALHHAAHGQLAHVSILVAEHGFAVFVCAGDRGTVKREGAHAVYEQAVELRAV